MPKNLFFTIASEKQSRVIDAALTEFSDKVYNEASINQIIKIADISRGSFYKYFEDKEELYFFIVNKIIESTAYAFMEEFMKIQHRNILLVYRGLFLYNLKMLSDKRYEAFMKNLYLSMNYEFLQKFRMIISKIRNNVLSDKVKDLNMKSESDKRYFTELMNILELINRDLLTMKIANDLDDKSIIAIYDFRIQVLCNISTDFKYINNGLEVLK